MKTFKIAIVLLATLFLTVSGADTNKLESVTKKEVKQPTKYDLLAHNKDKATIPPQG